MTSNQFACRTFGVLLVCLALSACSRSAQQQKSTTTTGGATAGNAALVRVTAVRPARKTLVRRTEQPGRVEAFEESPLFAKLAGYVTKINVDIGDSIAGPKTDSHGKASEPGQVLAELSIPELDEEHHQKESLVGQAHAEVQQAVAAVRVAEAAQGSAQAKLEETQATVERAQADYDRYKSEFERIRELAEKGAVNRQVTDEKENQMRAASAARKEVVAKIASAKAAIAESLALLEKAKADHETSQAKLRVAGSEEQRVAALLDYTHIRAPYDGVVSVRNVHTGHFVQPGAGSAGKPMFVVIRTEIVRIFVDVPEADAVLIHPGSEARIRIPSLSAETFAGNVTRSSWMLDSSTRTLKTEIDVENADGRLRPGMYAYADLKVAERTDALALPNTAVFTADGQTFCYTIDDESKVTRRPIVVGIRAGDDVEIVSGLAGDEQVIGVNPAAFREGQRVEVMAPQAKP
ncbi:MAG: efflux RND transporter periplasmic adaptor subunit [Planctomycetaceae bacterium]|nr:efflux RND transporter periplasmic adaptor subunit [Planctomycetaceae bacterium]